MKRLFVFTLFFSILLSLNFAKRAFAVDNSWGIGGACSTQGSWTQNALTNLNSLISVLKTYKDDEECKGQIGDAIIKFTALDSVINNYIALETGDIDNIKNNISVLTHFYDSASTSSESSYFLDLLLSATGDLATEQAGLGVTNSSNDAAIALAMNQLYNVLIPAINYFPQKECLVGRPNALLSLGSSAILIASSFAGGPFPLIGALAAKLIVEVVDYMRDARFRAGIEIGELAKLRSSILCAIETLTKDYCSANDMGKVLYWDTREENLNINVAPESYWGGYIALNDSYPKALNWLMKIIGFLEPQTEEDLNRQEDLLMLESFVYVAYERLDSIIKYLRLTYNRDADTETLRINSIVDSVLKLDEIVVGINRSDARTGSMAHTVFDGLFIHSHYTLRTFIYWLLDYDISNVTNPSCLEIIAGGIGSCDWEATLKPIIIQKYGQNYSSFFDDMEKKINDFKGIVTPLLEKLLEQVSAKDKVLILTEAFDKSTDRAELSVFENIGYVSSYLRALLNRVGTDEEWKNPLLKVLLSKLTPKFEKVYTILSEFDDFLQEHGDISKTGDYKPLEIERRSKIVLDSIAETLMLKTDRDRYISTNLRKIVENDYTTRVILNDFGDDTESMVRISKGNMINSVRSSISSAASFLTLAEAKTISYDSLRILSTSFGDNLLDSLEYYRERENTDDRMHTNYNLRARLCVLLSSLPEWPSEIDINMCRGSVLFSIYNLNIPEMYRANSDDYISFRKSLNIYFDDSMNLPFEDRACQFYRYLNKDILFKYYRRVRK